MRKTFNTTHRKDSNFNVRESRNAYTHKKNRSKNYVHTEEDVIMDTYLQQYKIPQCTNCGELGHVYRNCVSPITSYGIIAIKFTTTRTDELSLLCSSNNFIAGIESTNDVKFLLIQRKDSLAFVEFVRGKYVIDDDFYIGRLLKGMTKDEQHKLLTLDFDVIWKNVWGDTNKSHKSNFESSLRKFNEIKSKLSRLISENKSQWTEPEWGFPKGRRNPYESDIACAIREFQEETNLQKYQFSILQNIDPITETFFGSNHVHYCHKYYISICSENTDVAIHSENPHMAREIGNIAWCTLEEALDRIRPDNIEKREILLKAGRILRIFRPINIHQDRDKKHNTICA
jgi:8-oxo-dGTP pyrophosphatase MutT (NUDIX family)